MKEKFEKFELTVTPLLANVLAFVYVLPIAVISVILFIRLFGKSAFFSNAIPNVYIFFLIVILGIFFHEFLHGLGWSFFTKDGFKSINFGFSLKALTPYTHCSKMLSYYQFIVGVVFPALILGIIPIILSFIFVKSWLLIYGIIFMFGAGGDLVIFFMILKHKSKNVFIMDHPEKIGCILLKKGDT